MPAGRLVFRFGPFEFDPQSGALSDGRQRHTLRPRTGQVLDVLLRRPGEVVTHEEFRRALWDEYTHVDYEQALANAMWELRQALGDDARAPAYIEVLPRRGHRFLAPVTATSEPLAAPLAPPPHPVRHDDTGQDRVAVLPFEDLAATPGHDGLGVSLADTVISSLSGLTPVAVVSHSSSARFAHPRRPLGDIARQLDATFVVEGTVEPWEQHVQVNVHLVRCPADTVAWAHTYERVRAAPGSVAALGRRIAHDLQVALVGLTRPGAEPGLPLDADLRRRYLKAQVLVSRRVTKDVLAGLTLYRECVEHDPTFAAAWTGLGYAHVLAGWVGLLPRPLVLPRAVEAARRALALDDTLCQPHVVLGLAAVFDRLAWQEADDEFACARALGPACPLSCAWHGWLCSWRARHDEAVAALREASRLDPLLDTTSADLVRILFHARRCDEALAAARDARRLAPEDTYLGWSESLVLLHEGRLDEAVAQLDALSRRNPHQAIAAALGFACGRAGAVERAEAILGDLASRAATEHVWAAASSLPLIGLGRLEEAIACLERGWEARDLWAEQLLVDPLLDPLRGHPRFEALVRKVGVRPPSAGP